MKKITINRGLQFRMFAIVSWFTIVILTVWLTLSGYIMTLADGNIIIGVILVFALLMAAQIIYVLLSFIGGRKGANNKLSG